MKKEKAKQFLEDLINFIGDYLTLFMAVFLISLAILAFFIIYNPPPATPPEPPFPHMRP